MFENEEIMGYTSRSFNKAKGKTELRKAGFQYSRRQRLRKIRILEKQQSKLQ